MSTPPIATRRRAARQQKTATDGPRVAQSAAILSIAMAVAYAGTYLLAVAASRLLNNSQYGEFASLLAVLTVVTVPGLALQAVIARRAATSDLCLRDAIVTGLVVGLGCAALAMAVLPGLQDFLHLGGIAGMAATLGATLPLSVLSAIQGWLQGREQFGPLATVLLVAGGAKLLGGLVPLLAGGSADASLIGIALMTALVTIAAALSPRLTGGERADLRTRRRSVTRQIPWSELGSAAVGFGGLLLLSNLDLLLARHSLTGSASGHYAAATVIAKVALWIPQGIALAVLPRLAHADSRAAALRASIALTIGFGVVSCAVMLGFGTLAMRITFGPSYASLGKIGWMFALQGTALALTQLMVIADIAQKRRGILTLILVAAVVETGAVFAVNPGTAKGLITIATITAVALAVLATLRQWRSCQWAASSQVRPTPTETSSATSPSS
jgi:O-antigen/teichoic acid export membrane protein